MDFVRPIEAIVPGAQGRVLEVLARTTDELNLRTIARLAGISPAQTSRVLPRLAYLGIVRRREVPPASLFSLALDHVAAGPLLALAASRQSVLDEIGRAASELVDLPISAIVFGSLARGEADAESDIDLAVVRPTHIDEDDDSWVDGLESLRQRVRDVSGNQVEILEVGVDDVAHKLTSNNPVWADICREGRVVYGRSIDELREIKVG
ncbi:MAG: nucleotidyltransferase domain-containing protein [Microthrixaceae bacterium]|nr:nucleotidyltransferase domain-containing protein [Microthrixaceae bacterium]